MSRTEIPQRSGLLPHPSALSFRLEAWWPFFADGDFVSGGIADAHEQSIFNRAKNLVVSA
jgi:hypothetical protein